MTWRTVLAVDFDKHAAATYRANFPNTDVRCCRVEDILPELREGMADVVMGGFPCQPHSVAGKRLASADDRDGGDVFLEAGLARADGINGSGGTSHETIR